VTGDTGWSTTLSSVSETLAADDSDVYEQRLDVSKVGDFRGTIESSVGWSIEWWGGGDVPSSESVSGLLVSLRRHRSEQYSIERQGLLICFSHTVQYWGNVDDMSSSGMSVYRVSSIDTRLCLLLFVAELTLLNAGRAGFLEVNV
jgi:hypothetical protein